MLVRGDGLAGSTLQSTVSKLIGVVVVGVTMLFLSWQVTMFCLLMVPIL